MSQLRRKLAAWIAGTGQRRTIIKPGVEKSHNASDNAPYTFVIGPDFSQTISRWDDDYFAYAEEGYRQNAYVFAAIAYKMRSSTIAPRRAFTGDEKNPVWLDADNDTQHLILQPNEFMSRMQLQMIESLYFNLAGNSYTFIERGEDGQPIGLWPMRPDRVRILPGDDGTLKGFAYIPDFQTGKGSFPIEPGDMIHVKWPDALDPFEGLGKGMSFIRPMAWEGDIDNALTKFLKGFVDGGVMPTGLLSFDKQLSESDIAKIKRRWRETHGGWENWSDVLVLDSRVEYQRVGLLLNEMAFESLDNRNESRMLAALAVPPILIGTRFGLERSTDTNYRNARRAFWEDVMLFELGLFADVYSQRLLPDDPNINIGHFTARVPALRGDIAEQSNAAKMLYDMGMPAMNALDVVGIEAEEFDGGDIPFGGQVLFMETTRIESRQPSADDEDENEDEQQDEDDDEDNDTEDMRAARLGFQDDEIAVLAILDSLPHEAQRERRSWLFEDAVELIEVYYDRLALHWLTIAPTQHTAIRRGCRDSLILEMYSLDARRQKLSQGRQAVQIKFSHWQTVRPPQIVAKDRQDVLAQDGDAVITEGDVDDAIENAGDIDTLLQDLLTAEPIDEVS